jgi:peptidyl-prolyl cis-trans isomerase C
MTCFRSLYLLVPAAFLLAQTPPPKPAQSTPVPQPTITLTTETGPPLPDVPPDKVVMTVGDQKITAAQFNQIIDSLPEQYRATARGVGRAQFADNLVRVIALAQEGKRQKLDQDQTFKTQEMFQSENLLASLTYQQISKNTKPAEAELRKYYDAHKSEYDQVRARHILVRFQGSPSALKPGQKELTEAEALAKAQSLKRRIQGGEDFAKIAAQESDDAGSGAQGGDLGAFRRGQMVPSFEQAAFAMKPGEVSEPVRSQFGYHIIKVESKEPRSFDDMRPELEAQLGPEQAKKVVEDVVAKTTVSLDPQYFPAPAKQDAPAKKDAQ